MVTLVIVPGSFCPGAFYKPFLETLKKQGLDAVIVDLPSVGRREGKGPNLTDDANAVATATEKLLGDGKEVVIVAHSYGGVPTTQSLERTSAKARSAAGKKGGVTKVIYLSAVLIQPGQSNFEAFGGEENIPVGALFVPNSDYLILDYDIIKDTTFNDMPADQRLAAAKQMLQHSANSFREPMTYNGYADVDIHYVSCQQDQIVPTAMHAAMLGPVRKLTEREVRVYDFDSGHCPNVSRPEDLAVLFREIVEGK